MIEFYTIAVVAILAAISPGPDFVVVAKYALSSERKTAYFSSLGIGVGILLHTTYCVLGLALIIANSLLLFSIIKYCGAAYLMYLGIKSFFSQKTGSIQTKRQSFSASHWVAFRDGFLTNVLNPKCTLFMISVFTLVVKPHTPPTYEAMFGVEIAMITAGWFLFLSYGLTHRVIKLKIERVQHIVEKLIGVVLFGIGLAVLFESR